MDSGTLATNGPPNPRILLPPGDNPIAVNKYYYIADTQYNGKGVLL